MTKYGSITLLCAHPDDEAIFLWPALKQAKKIVAASSDRFSKSRAWCAKRGEALREVCKLLGSECVIFDSESEFYRIPTRGGELKSLAAAVLGELRDCDAVFTHNRWGEYGHIDHMLCNHIAHCSGKPVLTTDAVVEINWLPMFPGSPARAIAREEIDLGLFSRIKSIYDSYGCWTWSFPVPQALTVFEDAWA